MGQRINVGCGNYLMEGHLNVDLFEPADVTGNFLEMRFKNASHVEMSHVLEHVSWRDTDLALGVVFDWLEPGGTIRVEVPDIEELFAQGTDHPYWQIAIFGIQTHAGEVHLAGFTPETLTGAMERAGFEIDSHRRFPSEHKERPGYPCIEVHAHRP